MTIEQMQARFHELGKQKKALVAQAAPYRQQHATIAEQVSALQLQMKGLAEQFRPIEQQIVPLDAERARLARALGGKTGPEPQE